MSTAGTSTSSQIRINAKRLAAAKKKQAGNHAKGKKFSGPSPHRLRIRA